jgi:hypothetical protein
MSQEPSAVHAPTSATPKPTLPLALLVVATVVVVIAGYLALANMLGIREAYIGFVFVFYWLSLEQGKLKSLPAILLGFCFGISAGWLLQYALHSPHVALLMLLFLAAVAISIVCLVLGRLPVLFNTPAMLVLTVVTIPHIQQGANFPWLYLALAFAAVYFTVVVEGLKKLGGRLMKAT